MVRRALLPLSVALAAVLAASLAPAVPAGAANMAGVIVRDSNFSPTPITIQTGDTVVFAKAQDAQLTHSVTSDSGVFDQELSTNQYVGLRFQQAGTYPYYCKYHGAPGGAGMAGVIYVQDSGATTTTATTAPGATTTTTVPGATTTTGPTTTTTKPTTTTTKPPKPTTTTTTKPPTTTTTAPPPPPPPTYTPPPPTYTPPPPPPSGPSAGGVVTPPPPAPRPTSPSTAPKGMPAQSGGGKDRAATANG
ncbi:MAG TPA: cupredoxin domain-containing protein, partial [Acidimicrobiia bacterium]|nr:cupredoxin domain-containing protein [Acidimicrobiia bacterium]